MKKFITVLGVACLFGLSAGVVLAGEGQAQGEGKGPGKGGQGKMGGEMFAKFDADGNGTLSLAEFKAMQEKRMEMRKAKMGDKADAKADVKMPSAEERFAKLDTNTDGQLTKDELAAGHQGRGGKGGEGRGHGKDAKKDAPAGAPAKE